jgi:hypothetical protein
LLLLAVGVKGVAGVRVNVEEGVEADVGVVTVAVECVVDVVDVVDVVGVVDV